jgi:hypothetical protein
MIKSERFLGLRHAWLKCVIIVNVVLCPFFLWTYLFVNRHEPLAGLAARMFAIAWLLLLGSALFTFPRNSKLSFLAWGTWTVGLIIGVLTPSL